MRIEKQRSLVWSLPIENFRKAISFSNKRTSLSLLISNSLRNREPKMRMSVNDLISFLMILSPL